MVESDGVSPNGPKRGRSRECHDIKLQRQQRLAEPLAIYFVEQKKRAKQRERR